jgi:hypothetical protein
MGKGWEGTDIDRNHKQTGEPAPVGTVRKEGMKLFTIAAWSRDRQTWLIRIPHVTTVARGPEGSLRRSQEGHSTAGSNPLLHSYTPSKNENENKKMNYR